MLAVAKPVSSGTASGPIAQLSEASYHSTHFFLHSFLRGPVENLSYQQESFCTLFRPL